MVLALKNALVVVVESIEDFRPKQSVDELVNIGLNNHHTSISEHLKIIPPRV